MSAFVTSTPPSAWPAPATPASTPPTPSSASASASASERPAIDGSPFQRLASLSFRELQQTRDLPAAERRLLVPYFVETFQWSAIRPLLPLPLVAPPGTPSALGCTRHWRSHYAWLPPEDLSNPAAWAGLDDFDLVLRLFDFSPWRPLLSQRFVSQLGPAAFDPVSLGLVWLLGEWRHWSWRQVLAEIGRAHV